MSTKDTSSYGNPDTVVYHAHDGGSLDVEMVPVKVDTNGDGRMDSYGFHTAGDGRLDHFEPAAERMVSEEKPSLK